MSFIFQLASLPFTVIGGGISLAQDGVGLAVQTVKDRRQRRKISSQLRYSAAQAGCSAQSPHCAKHCDCEMFPTAQDVTNDSPPSYSEAVEQHPTQALALSPAHQISSSSSTRLHKRHRSEKRRINSERGKANHTSRASSMSLTNIGHTDFDAQGSLLRAP